VLLHGWGAPGDDLVPLGEALAASAPMRVIVPAAPLAMSHGGRAWYDLHAPDADAQAARARARIEGVIATLAARGVPSERVVVGGFSQGAILSIEVGLARRRPLAGLALLSGRALSHPPRAYEALRGVPIFQSHGRQDERIPFVRGESFRERAVAAGAVLEHLPFDGGHAIPPEVVRALGAWLARVLSR
jgi:phospholipase/carboxylesterase